jgi:RNA polymerase sigma-70 factor (ECF subfamily)
MADRDDITQIIADWQRGDKAAENILFEALYKKLHSLAVYCLVSERPGQTLGPTALVHEAYLRFSRAEGLAIADRNHFMALAAGVMRRILVDKARARHAQKRSVEAGFQDSAEPFVSTDMDADEIISVDRALEQLAQQSPRQAQLIELRYFAGFSLEESAAVMDISARTARRDWQVARTRLRMAIEGSPPTGQHG